jgi:predicted amidohydrolase
MSKILFTLAIIILIIISFTASTLTHAARTNVKGSSSSTTRVAAVQIFPVSGGTPQQNIQNMANQVVNLVQQQRGIDFFNFPEFLFQAGLEYMSAGVCSGDGTNSSGTLNNYCFPVPVSGQAINCNALAAPANQVGCALSNSNVTVSVNVCELDETSGKLYNTQVIMQGGKTLATYRKYNPFFRNCFTKPDLELVTFMIKDLKFGVFTCFDLLNEQPKADLIKMGIKYFSYSVALPDLALDAVAIWSWKNSVTVVSSDADGGQSAVVINGKAMQQCTAKTGTCLAVYDL